MILFSKELEDKIDLASLEISEDQLDVRMLSILTEIVSLNIEKGKIKIESEFFPTERVLSIEIFSQIFLIKLLKVKKNKSGKFVSTFLISLTE